MGLDYGGKVMKICITGDKGFIGSHLAKQVGDYIPCADILGEIPEADVYIHLAELPSVPYSVEHPRETFETNVTGTLNVLEACRKYKSKIVFTSSSQGSPEALNPYGLHKHQCELMIKLYARLYHVPYCILRLYNVFGPGEHGVIGAFQKIAASGKPLEIWGGYQKRDFVYIDTVIDKLVGGIDVEGIFEIGSGRTYSVKQIADMISDDQILMPLAEGQPLETQCPTPVETLSVEEYLHVKA